MLRCGGLRLQNLQNLSRGLGSTAEDRENIDLVQNDPPFLSDL